MFHPVGNQPPSVYWRRRLVILGSIVLLLVLVVLTVRTLASDGGGTPAAAGSTSTSPSPSVTSAAPPASTHASSTAVVSTPNSTSGSTSRATARPARCTAAQLSVSAVVGAPSYRVGQHPSLMLQVVNVGRAPCVQNLADSQIELRVYNGESRVWGSHDCQIQPGTNDNTLPVGRPVRVGITWSGLTSQPKCAGTRQRVGAGTYTLYATLSGVNGKAAQFAIS